MDVEGVKLINTGSDGQFQLELLSSETCSCKGRRASTSCKGRRASTVEMLSTVMYINTYLNATGSKAVEVPL